MPRLPVSLRFLDSAIQPIPAFILVDLASAATPAGGLFCSAAGLPPVESTARRH